VKDLFDKLMAVNPSVEVYLLGLDGRIEAQAAPPGPPEARPGRRWSRCAACWRARAAHAGRRPAQRGRLQGVQRRAAEGDGRSRCGLRLRGAVQGEDRDALVANVAADNVLRTTLWSMGLVALLGLLAGLAAFRLITRPLRELTAAVRASRPTASPR
jgi:hypothetical protein